MKDRIILILLLLLVLTFSFTIQSYAQNEYNNIKAKVIDNKRNRRNKKR